MGADGRPDGPEAVRRLIARWPVPADVQVNRDDGLGTGLQVPPAAAEDVIHAVCRLVAEAGGEADAVDRLRARLGDERFAELRHLADALAIGEHPSADTWTAAERSRAVDWVAVLIDLQGEEGVLRLVAGLAGQG